MFVKERFALNKYTVDLLKDLEPNFGFQGFGEFVFYRTYSRYIDGYQETWADCVIRVISGCMSIRKDWYIKNGISWDEKWWQQYAKKMAISLFKMEWMAPGRGLWAMGTEFVYERGSMALNNCFVGDTLIVTDQGVMTLLQAVGMGSIENQRLKVIGKDGQWHYATVRCFGEQQLNVMRLSNGLTYTVTENHRWFLADGSETTQLKVGDEIEIRPIEFTNDEREFNDGYVHALVYLNGRQSHSFLYDLTIKDSKYRSMILDSKFYNSNRDDNYTLVTEDNLKSAPKGTTSDSYKRGFMMGLLIHGKLSMANKWVANYAVSLGYNYINGALTILPTIVTVESIIRTNVIDHVYCVVEPETHSFMLAGGVVTGNCGYTEVHDLLSDDIGWTMDSMMLGLGIGFTPVRNDKLEFKRSHGTGNDFVIPDSREGWVESEVRLIDALRLGLPKPRMIYDEIRDAGLLIKGFGGISSGPEPLMELHERTEELMNMYMEDKYYDSVMLKTDLQNNVGVAVVSGNVRRSAELAKNSIKDPTFRDLKNYEDPKYRYRRAFGWMSNNSVDLEDDEDFELLGEVAKRVITRGEPGICNLQNFKYGRIGKKDNVRSDRGRGTNACGEVILEGGVDLDGKSRVRELCNQAETLPTMCKDVETWLKACEYATLYASTVSLLPTHQPSTNRVIARNRRISIGIIDFSGWKHETSLHHVTKCQRLGYKKVREVNKRVNGEAGVPESIRVTTIKPGGTVPKLPGKTPGIGHPTFTYTLRRVNVAKNSPLMPLIIEAGVPYEDSVTDKYSYITEWPILQGPALPGENVSLWEQAMDLVLVQREWADNAVSNTLYFKPKWVLFKLIGELIEIRAFLGNHIINEDDYIKAIVKIESEEDEIFVQDLKITYNSDDGYKIYKYNPHHEEHHIEPVLSAIAPLTKTVSLLPHTAAGVYAQMPEEGISKEEYERRLAAIKKIDWSQLKGSDGSDERYCQGSQCEMPIKE